MSARIIRAHVKDGLQLAEEYRLPKVVSDFIPMHHVCDPRRIFLSNGSSAS